jgi:hypothetical protein
LNEQSTSAPDDSSPPAEPTKRIFDQKRFLQIGGVVLIAAAAGGAAFFLGRTTDSSNGNGVPPVKTVALSASGLRTLAAVVPQPIFWAGPRAHYLYELKRTADAKVYIRYLPPGVNVGASGNFLTIGTFPHAGAFAALEHTAQGHGIPVQGGGLALVDSNKPNSVHVAFPKVAYDVEVTDSSPARALAVVKSGEVGPAS